MKNISKEIGKSSLAYIILCVGLIWMSKVAIQSNDLLYAWVFIFTSNLLTLTYLFGLRKYIKQLQEKNVK